MTTPPKDSTTWAHPLIAPYEPRRMDRRRLLLMAGAGVAAGVSLAPLHLVTAQSSTPEAETQITGEDDAQTLLSEAVTAMAELETFAFEIETIAGETVLMDGISLKKIEGVIQRPSSFSATVEVSTPFGSISLTATGDQDEAWIQNPIQSDEWISLGGLGDIASIVNPDTLVLAAVGTVKQASIDGSDQIDGKEVTRIAGIINLAEAASATDGSPVDISDQPLAVLIWVGADGYIREIEIAGPILATEEASVIRVIRFFDFNEPVEIVQPDI